MRHLKKKKEYNFPFNSLTLNFPHLSALLKDIAVPIVVIAWCSWLGEQVGHVIWGCVPVK
jgi:hypothetical protein